MDNLFNLRIDPEFQRRLPPLRDQEHKELEESVKQEGCRDRLFVWDQGDERILIDGHNRYEICREYSIPFETESLKFGSRDEVLTWIDKHQVDHRNLSDADYKIVIGRIYNERKKTRGGDRRGSNSQVASLKNGAGTADQLADEHGLSADTVRRNGKRAEVYDFASEAGDNDAAKLARELPQQEIDEIWRTAHRHKDQAAVKAAATDELNKKRNVTAPNVKIKSTKQIRPLKEKEVNDFLSRLLHSDEELVKKVFHSLAKENMINREPIHEAEAAMLKPRLTGASIKSKKTLIDALLENAAGDSALIPYLKEATKKLLDDFAQTAAEPPTDALAHRTEAGRPDPKPEETTAAINNRPVTILRKEYLTKNDGGQWFYRRANAPSSGWTSASPGMVDEIENALS